jgi:hypothetical protein
MCVNDSHSQKQGEHGVRPYANVVGASDQSPVGAGLGSRNSMFALARNTNGTDGATA